ncbi:UDP-glucuronosyltransferase 2B15-like [Ostrinia furnacalis]|uniref:UDP-glucuronosyltransferase 2B15-like n=1 Tax=Ostrinia furnacalis TaxID=93504 RepID=UPI00103D1BDA|nr:UDP-glucuronosyltransferase 2B15-like [Ostrinia furnacalis]
MDLTKLLFLLLLGFSSAYKILVVFPYPGKSHTILGEGFVKHLVRAGHEVTYITPIPIKNPPKGLRQIDVSSNIKTFESMSSSLSFKTVLNKEADLKDTRAWVGVINNIANQTIWHQNVQKLMYDVNEEFDLVIAEWLYTELYCGFAAVFNCPFIWSSSIDPHGLVLRLIDEEANPAYTANHMSSSEAPFTFSQRLEELWEVIYLKYMKWAIYDHENRIFQEGYGPAVAKRGRTIPSLYEVSHNASLMFGNSHFSSGRPVRLPQNYIPIAGYHIDEEVKPLPTDIQKIMDNAQHGVIYFSMGSMIRSSSMPDGIKQGFLKMFGSLKQTVIWKFEEVLPNLPKNLHILKWAPQQSILAHPNCLLFISHGGLLSTSEALHYGVPIIGIPMFADQFINVDRAMKKGFALKVDIVEDMTVHLKAAIEEILGNPRYHERMKELSFIYHHRTVTPGQEILHWVDHVIKTRGALHLRSPALNVPFYQKIYLDLITLIAVATIVLFRIAKRLLCKSAVTKKVKKN